MIHRLSHLAFAVTFTLCACNGAKEPAPSPAASETVVPATDDPEPLPLPTDAAETDEPGLPASFRALGTEPFWALHVSEGRMRYMTPDDQQGQLLEYTREETGKNETALTARLGDQDLVLAARVGECSDGMSDLVYPYSVTLRIGEEVLNGCARPVEP